MKSYEFELKCKPFSVNAYYFRDLRVKTKEARAWEAEVMELLEEHRKALQDLVAPFSSTCSFGVEFTAVYPKHVYYAQHGGISSKTIDITNFEKPLMDLIFKNVLELNDKYVVKCISRKEPGLIYSLRIKLKLYTHRQS